MGKVWKNGGRQDKFIEKLFNEGKISKSITASILKRRYGKMFKGFTEDLIEKRIIILKKILTLNYDRNNSISSHPKVIQENIPTLCETYKDPDTGIDMVFVAVAVPGGAEDVKFEVGDCRTIVTVTYCWPKAMYTMEDLFKRDISAGNISASHPKMLAVENGLRKCRQQIDDIPKSKIDVKLPIAVMTTAQGKISGIAREDGTKIVMAELVAFPD